MLNCCSHGTSLNIGPQGSYSRICYYHQDLHQWQLQADSRLSPSTLTTATLLLVKISYFFMIIFTVEYEFMLVVFTSLFFLIVDEVLRTIVSLVLGFGRTG